MNNTFNKFLENSYWKEIYTKAPRKVQAYYQIAWENTDNHSEEISNRIAAQRDIFEKSDWLYLISVSTGRAKAEYTRMMNEHFPEKVNVRPRRTNTANYQKLVSVSR